ncbi:DUF475 domain-containing protein [Gordonia sp. PKS22-38]|uniref:DUF475 domain-containing protein n=1 Tax=Gordonia prachuapensis TaxID=3115651 RepID=A0ABU7MZI8_9ACTN|nr:DUF475 domain-containing protein [Gordonia sp. PKS22-38]
MIVRIFGLSIVVTLAALAAAFLYQGWTGLALCAILGILEISLSFDNAVINATVLERMSMFWQRMFLTVGILIAVFGMRLLFPLAIVWITGGLAPLEALRLALNPPPGGADHFPDGSPSYETILLEAHPQIAAFGGMFLLLLFLNFMLADRSLTWLSWIERPLRRLGQIDQITVVIAAIVLVVIAEYLAPDETRATILISGLLGMITYLLVNGLSTLFQRRQPGITEPESPQPGTRRPAPATAAVGRAGFFLFLYLEVLDASFSFDGVIGAFAITSDPIIIALGLGFIGAIFVRSITIYLVRQGTLGQYRYLEHGAHWAIGALAVILLVSVHVHINEVVTGLIGVVFIGAAFASSVYANRREARRTPVVT